MLSRSLAFATHTFSTIAFTAKTSANATQDVLLAKLEKQRKGVYGPAVGMKMVVFIDDFNMPRKERYGDQPVLELVRQLLDLGFWYNRKDFSLMHIENLILLVAMGMPGM